MTAGLAQDARFAVRSLLRSPGAAGAILLTLALGIGLNTALFSLVHAVLIRPLPFPGAERLVLVWAAKPRSDWPQLPLSLPNFEDLRSQARSFEGMAAWIAGRYNLTAAAEPEQIQYALVSASLFEVLGVSPALGRTFEAGEDRPGGARIAVLGHGLWRRRFRSDPGAIGSTVTLDGQAYEVVGVLPEGFRFISFPAETEVWLPLGNDPFQGRRYARGLNALGVVARLKEGASLAEANAELSAIAGRLEAEHPGINAGLQLSAVPLGSQAVRHVRTALLVLMGAVAFVLLIACVNVSNLLLARAAARGREIAVRAALGAGRPRIIRQLLTESLLLSLAGGAAGLLVAFWALDLIKAVPYGGADLFTPYTVARDPIVLDLPALGFSLGLSVATAMLFGLAPALRISRPDLGDALREEGPRSGTGRRAGRARRLLVAGEVALATVLLTGAALLARGLASLVAVDQGFRADGVLALELNLPESRYGGDRGGAFYEQLLDHVAAIPGVRAVGASEHLPLGGTDADTGILVEGRPPEPPGEGPRAHYRSVSEGYFRALGIPLLAGRPFAADDGAAAPRVAIVNETMARRLWPGEDAVGKRVALDFEAMRFHRDRPPEVNPEWGMRTIVGVVADVRHTGPAGAPLAEMYLPFRQRPVRGMSLVAAASGDPLALVGPIRRAVQAMDPQQPIAAARPMARLAAAAVARPRFNAILMSAFAGLALVLAAVGVYGVISYSVTRRTREIGIRMALGAAGRDVLAQVLREGLAPAAAGLALGLAGSLALARLLSSLLHGAGPADPASFAAAAAVLAAAALLACWLPARRAAGLDPMAALREE